KQIISMRARYQNYRSYATASMDQLLTGEQRAQALRVSSNYALSGYFENLGGGKFRIRPLPAEAQLSMLNGMVAEDFNGDGNLDLAINGNDFGTEVTVGRYDALNGLVLLGDGKGNFRPLRILESGIFIPGNGKALTRLQSATGGYLLAATQNRGPLKVFLLKRDTRTIPVAADEVSAEIRYADGRIQKRELYYGSSFLSQSARAIDLTAGVSSVSVTDHSGKVRVIRLGGR
ncbi:MAG TPA: RNA-binding protein, partial [Sphingobacteriaceae bacterium]